MSQPARPIAFVLTSTNHGTMIVNRNDYCHSVSGGPDFGVGRQLLEHSHFDPDEINLALILLRVCRKHAGDGVLAIDCGANIGVHSVEWGRALHGWGAVIAFEAQEKVYYALAGNLAINNCFNVTAHLAAVGRECGQIDIPVPDYLQPASFGSLELRQRPNTEFIGQPIDYGKTRKVPLVSLDSLALPRVDFIKIDVEGMEEDVLAGASALLDRHRPMMMIEIIKSDPARIKQTLEQRGYHHFNLGINLLAIHRDSPLNASIRFENNQLIIVG